MALLNTIKNFTGAYRREGFNIVKLQGKEYLTSGFRTAEHRSSQNDDANLTVIKDFDSVAFNDDVASTKQEQIIGITGSNIVMFSDGFSNTYDIGIVHSIPNVSDVFPISDNPGVMTTTNNNIFYTSGAYLGCGYLFKATSATATSITVTGETFNSTYGIDDDVWNSKIYNITKGEEYTNTTATPTDTLGFATATTTPEADDVFMVFNDKAFSFSTPLEKGNHFASQDFPYLWDRPIVAGGDYYYILNGNYIARVDVSADDATSSTMEATWQPFDFGKQALCFDINTTKLLVGLEHRGSYELSVFDRGSFGSLSTISLPAKPSSIIAYNNGWLIMAGGTLYFSDGYQLKKMATIPDFENNDTRLIMANRGMSYKGDNVFILTESISDRYGNGLFVYNFKYGWSFTTLNDDNIKSRDDIETGAIIKYKDEIYSSYKVNNGTNNYVIGDIYESGGDTKRIGLLFHFDGQTSITQVGLTLSEIYDENNTQSTADITVNYANARRALHVTGTNLGSGNATNSLYYTSGIDYNSEIGQKVLLTSGNIAGETTYITDIDDKGTFNERWTVSPLLSTPPSDSSGVLKYNLYKSGTKTIDLTNIDQDIRFSTNFTGDIMYLEIELENGYLDISNIRLYG